MLDRYGMVKRFVFASVAFVALATVAAAADVPAKEAEPEFKEEAPPPMPIFSWTGPYVGLHAGYGFGRDSGVGIATGASPQTFGVTPNGVMGGAHAGYNYAFGTGHTLVIGVEADVDGAAYRRSSTPFGGMMAGGQATTQSDIKGSARGRLGYAANRTLFYATGGIAVAEFDTRYNMTPLLGNGAFDAIDRTRTGYTLGGGVEYAFMNYLSVRAEYRYTSYGTFIDAPTTAAPVLNALVSHRETDNRLQAGLSYKFDSIAPTPTSQ